MSLKILLGKFIACFAGQVPVEGHKNIIDSFQKLIVSPKRFICTHGEQLSFRFVRTDGRKKQAPAGVFPPRLLLLCVYLPYWDMRNSAISVELLIFVTNQGSGRTVVVTCSRIGLPIGVGPKAIE